MSLLTNALLKLARSPLGGRLIGWSFTHMSFAIPVRRLAETPGWLAFHHPAPAYPLHVLLVPRQALAGVQDLSGAPTSMLGELFALVQTLVAELDLERRGYRLVVNGGAYQDVQHLHFHLISGSAGESAQLFSTSTRTSTG